MAKKGEKISEKHRQAIIAHNKSRVWTDEQRKVRGEMAKRVHTGRKRSEETKLKISLSQIGQRRKTIYRTPLTKAIRRCLKYRQWRSDIYERDNYTCQFCGVRGVRLNADHIKSFALILNENKIETFEESQICEELWNINNGRTLCEPCHKALPTHGRPVHKQI